MLADNAFPADADARARLVALAAARPVSLAALSAMLGRNAAYLQQFVRKGSPRRLEERDRRKLARFFGVPESELGAPAEEVAAPAETWASVPRIDSAASAGPGAIAADDGALGELRFPVDWLRRLRLDPAHVSVIAVRGDSMEPALHDGDEILVDTSPAGAALREAGAGTPPIHVVRLGEALLVKRVARAGQGRLRLISDNPGYAPVEVGLADAVVIGRVAWRCGAL